MNMKKLLATALVLLMSMMACVPAFADGWPNEIYETIDCTGFTKDETDECWDWDHKTKTLKITGDSSMGPYVGLCMLVFMGMLAGDAVLNRKKAK